MIESTITTLSLTARTSAKFDAAASMIELQGDRLDAGLLSLSEA